MELSANCYYNGGWKYYASNGIGVSNYEQYNGVHIWRTAAAGTAGNPVSFSTPMTLTAAGLLSIGTTNASGARIRGQGATNANALYYLDADGPFGGSPSYSSILGFALYTDSGTRYNSQAEIRCISDSSYSGSLSFWTQNPGTYPNSVTERMRVAANGNVGINNNDPQFKLDVIGSTTNGSGIVTTLRLKNGGTAYQDGAQILFTAGTSTIGAAIASTGQALDSADLRFYTGGSTERMQITAGGDIYQVKSFYIGNASNTTSIISSGSGAAPLLFGINGSERARVNTSGFFKASNDGTYAGATGSSHERRTSVDGNYVLTTTSSASSPFGFCSRTYNKFF
jgi:hypothetical protein